MGAIHVREERPEYTVDDVVRLHSKNLRWDRELKNNLRRGRMVKHSVDNVWVTQYRPFVRQHCYVEYVLVNNKYQQDRIFPPPTPEVRTLGGNRAIGIPTVGDTKRFSCVMVAVMPDLNVMTGSQWFPRYRYESRIVSAASREPARASLFASKLERVDNITDTALVAFREHYGDEEITEDAIFDYVYGVLHAPAYRESFADDLSKALPRIPFAPNFDAFAEAGRGLAALHLGYETCAEHSLEVVEARPGGLQSHHFRLGERAMRFADNDRTVLIVNDHIRLAGIPDEAHGYMVNGRTPLEWFIDRYRVTRDRESGIVNDPNGWFAKPEDLIAAIRRIVHVSVETVRIVASLPGPFAD